MNMQSVSSRLLSAIGYDPESQTLRVTFASSGASYDYSVSQADYDALRAADSLGGHFLKNIKPSVTGVRVGQ